MPYKSVSDLPPAVKKLPDAKQRQWMKVFNSCYGDKAETDPESKCFKIAWGAVGGINQGDDIPADLFIALHDPANLGIITAPVSFSGADGWIEVFRAGDYGDKGTFTNADLDTIVANYSPTDGHEAPACVGHPEHNKPAVGWVEAIKHSGGVLHAKFKQLNPKFLDLLQSGAFKKRSISLYTSPKLMLRHIGFLGAMPPEVKGLIDPVFHDDGAGHPYKQILFEEGHSMEITPQAIKDAVTDAFKSIFGDKPPKQFSEDDIKKLTTDAVTAASTKLTADLAKVQKDFDDYKAAQTSTATVAERKLAVDTVIGNLKAKNKYLPAFDEMGLPAVMIELAGSKTEVKFGEDSADGKNKAIKKSPLQVIESFLDQLPQLVPIGDVTTAARKVAVAGPVRFNDPGKSQDVVGIDLANAAAMVAQRDKISYGEALIKVRRGEVTVPGSATAGKS